MGRSRPMLPRKGIGNNIKGEAAMVRESKAGAQGKAVGMAASLNAADSRQGATIEATPPRPLGRDNAAHLLFLPAAPRFSAGHGGSLLFVFASPEAASAFAAAWLSPHPSPSEEQANYHHAEMPRLQPGLPLPLLREDAPESLGRGFLVDGFNETAGPSRHFTPCG